MELDPAQTGHGTNHVLCTGSVGMRTHGVMRSLHSEQTLQHGVFMVELLGVHCRGEYKDVSEYALGLNVFGHEGGNMPLCMCRV
jgi:hypothetical protein